MRPRGAQFAGFAAIQQYGECYEGILADSRFSCSWAHALTAAGVAVSGRVIRPASQNVTVTQRAFLNGSSSEVTSINADGSFTFSNVRPGTYQLTINSGLLSQAIS